MSEHPILFSAPMVRAILSGSKTQTRRVLKPQPVPFRTGPNNTGPECEVEAITLEGEKPRLCLGRVITGQKMTRWAPGDRLWVREAWNVFALSSDGDESWPVASIPTTDPRSDPEMRRAYCVDYPVEGLPGRDGGKGPWRPSIHMLRWASRITLAVEAVRVERLQDISEGDAIAEGCDVFTSQTPIRHSFNPEDKNHFVPAFRELWADIHGPDAWDANPWVSVTTFRRVEA